MCTQSHGSYISPNEQWLPTKKVGGVMTQLSCARRQLVRICLSRFEYFGACNMILGTPVLIAVQ